MLSRLTTPKNNSLLLETLLRKNQEIQLFALIHYQSFPLLRLTECGICLECEVLCPTGAMDVEFGEAEKGKFIACLACLANCPEQALAINDMSKSWAVKLEKEHATEESLKGQKSKIYY
jgi:uncharacterized Fe-S center protein